MEQHKPVRNPAVEQILETEAACSEYVLAQSLKLH
jgi:hypothetical protein